MTLDNTEQYLFLANDTSSSKKCAESPQRKSIKSPKLLKKIIKKCAEVDADQIIRKNSGKLSELYSDDLSGIQSEKFGEKTLNLADIENSPMIKFPGNNGSPKGVLLPPAMNKPKGFAAISAAKVIDDQNLREKYAKIRNPKNPVLPYYKKAETLPKAARVSPVKIPTGAICDLEIIPRQNLTMNERPAQNETIRSKEFISKPLHKIKRASYDITKTTRKPDQAYTFGYSNIPIMRNHTLTTTQGFIANNKKNDWVSDYTHSIDPEVCFAVKLFKEGTSLCKISDQLEIGEQIGMGSFAMVYTAKDLLNGNTDVAVKIYEKKNLTKGDRMAFVQHEILILNYLKDSGVDDYPSIARFSRALEDPTAVFLIQEKCNKTSLSEYMRDCPNKRLPEPEVRNIYTQIVSAVKFIHSKNICHRDLKLTNILISQNYRPTPPNTTSSDPSDPKATPQIKLIDFGFSMFSTKKYRTYCGTPSYMAPEIINREYYDGLKIDIWAMGVILYKMVCGGYPFGMEEDLDLEMRIRKGKIDFPDFVGNLCKD